MTELTQEKLVYNPKELEPLLQLSKNTINALLRSGRLRSVRVGRRYLIPREAIQQFLAGAAPS
ncbi:MULTISPECIES: helix-turn-helix domain-containing protein [unclassified Deinococcus]|uniref:helix-turn-helix domain-containing protein n=1 Tax=unclassified Deinococcus TaxID=2623546 RepID=UPI001C2F3D50|nr:MULTISPECIES: helix-turn-helix domain-containing protein [unclassified Deinococcus]MDK2012265.1 helix-turn-helix domain-containing protein [Deinococcus sp. 43]